MKITILCSDPEHPVNGYLERWMSKQEKAHAVELIRSRSDLTDGDFLFLISCSEIVRPEHRSGYRNALVLHASDLPRGRGWSPHVWEIVNGAKIITLCLLEADDPVDTGRIWFKRKILIEPTALWHDVNHSLFEAEIELMTEAVECADKIQPQAQSEVIEPSYYRRRGASDSLVNPERSIADQFNLLRMCDPERYPAWFEMHGQKYKVILEKLDDK